MSGTAKTVKGKVKEYHRPIPAGYFWSRRGYAFFMIRELTSAALGGYAIFLLILMAKARDEAAFLKMMEGLSSPLSIFLHAFVLAAALYHTVTFFNLAPSVLALHQGEDKVPDKLVAGAHYAAWIVVSIVLIFIAARG